MNNTVYDVDFTRALPAPLRNDEKMLALGRAIAGELQENIRLARLTVIYARIDELDETLLDILARDLHIDWYDDTHPIDIKRAVIKNSVKIHKRLGTKYAIETALSNIYPDSRVREWFEYGGTHHRFRILLGSSDGRVPVNLAEIVRVANFYKRLTAHLDEVITDAVIKSMFFVAGGVETGERVKLVAELPPPYIRSGPHIAGGAETTQRVRLRVSLEAPRPQSYIYAAAPVQTRERAGFLDVMSAPRPITTIYAAGAVRTRERVTIIAKSEIRSGKSNIYYGNAVTTTERTVI